MCAQMWSGSRGVSSGRRGAARSRGLRDRVEIVHGGSVARRLDGSRRHGGGTAAARTAAPRQLGGSAARRLGGSGSGGTSTGSRVGQRFDVEHEQVVGLGVRGTGRSPHPGPRGGSRPDEPAAREAGGVGGSRPAALREQPLRPSRSRRARVCCTPPRLVGVAELGRQGPLKWRTPRAHRGLRCILGS